jgi:hypothetical protein
VDFIVIVAVLPLGIMMFLATMIFVTTILLIVDKSSGRKGIRHMEYDYYQMPDGHVRYDERS